MYSHCSLTPFFKSWVSRRTWAIFKFKLYCIGGSLSRVHWWSSWLDHCADGGEHHQHPHVPRVSHQRGGLERAVWMGRKRVFCWLHKPFSVTYNLIPIWGHCCGIVDQYSFQSVTLKEFLPTKSEYKVFQVPPTCYQSSYFEKGVKFVVHFGSMAQGVFNVRCYQTSYIWRCLCCSLYHGGSVAAGALYTHHPTRSTRVCSHWNKLTYTSSYKKHPSLFMLE